MKWLKANIRFLVVAVVLIALLVLANGEFGDIAKSLDAKQNQAKTMLTANYRALFTDAAKFNGDPATVEGRKMQDRTQVTNALTTLVNERMTFETDPAYTLDSLPQGTSVDEMINFLRNEKKPELQRELGFQRYFGPDVRDDSAFGFKLPAQATLTEDQVRDYLRKLDMVRCVAHCVERTGVQRLDKLDFKAIKARYWKDDTDLDLKRRKEAEFLVSGDLPVSAILGFIVFNENAKNRLLAVGLPDKQIHINSNAYF